MGVASAGVFGGRVGGATQAFLGAPRSAITIHASTHRSMTSPHEPRFWFELPNAPAPGTALATREALPDGQATLVNWPADAALPDPSFKMILLRSGEVVRAFANRCAHFGTPLAAKQEQLIFKPHISITCNVHYARYRWEDGSCECGALLPIPVTMNAQGQICIALPTAPTGLPTA
jgi:nitrite reductase/ring-hydroxylating ferredoxin subunit